MSLKKAVRSQDPGEHHAVGKQRSSQQQLAALLGVANEPGAVGPDEVEEGGAGEEGNVGGNGSLAED
jgi:hypothetical protein